MAYKTLQNPWAEGLGNDYEQDKDTYVVDKDPKTGKTTWRDGIYTKLAYDIKDPMGYNKRTVNIAQDKWGAALKLDGTEFPESALSGETDGSALFTSGYGQAVSFGQPFNKMDTAMANFVDAATGEDAKGEDYYTSADKVKVPQGIDVAPFRDVASKEDVDKTV